MNPSSPKRIRLLEVIGNAIVGGMESWVERLLARLPAERFEVSALCPFESHFTDRLRALGLEVAIAPLPENPLWDSIQSTLAFVQSRNIDLLHAHLPNAHALAGLVGRLAGKPVLATLHGRQMTPLDLQAHRSCATYLSAVCHHSYFHALALGASASRLSCEPNGVDTVRFQPAEQRSRALRDALRLDPDTPLVGFVGRLSPEKGPEVFVRMALLLKGLRPDAHCVLVGEGPMDPVLRSLASRLDLDDRVHFAGLRRDMAPIYQDLDLVVGTSHSEAMPLALMEAMASGLPVIATRVGGVPEIVEQGESGWLVAPADFEDMAGRVEALLADDALRQRMGQRARLRALSRFGLEASSARVIEVIERLAGSAQTAPRSLDAAGPTHPAASERPGRARAVVNGGTIATQ